MHPSFVAHTPSATQPNPNWPPDFKFRQAGGIKKTSVPLHCRLDTAIVQKWKWAPVKSKQALGLIAEAGLCQEIRRTGPKSNEVPSDFSMPSVTRFRGAGRIRDGLRRPHGQTADRGAGTRDVDGGSSTFVNATSTSQIHGPARA